MTNYVFYFGTLNYETAEQTQVWWKKWVDQQNFLNVWDKILFIPKFGDPYNENFAEILILHDPSVHASWNLPGKFQPQQPYNINIKAPDTFANTQMYLNEYYNKG